jgi:hypothetical protein
MKLTPEEEQSIREAYQESGGVSDIIASKLNARDIPLKKKAVKKYCSSHNLPLVKLRQAVETRARQLYEKGERSFQALYEEVRRQTGPYSVTDTYVRGLIHKMKIKFEGAGSKEEKNRTQVASAGSMNHRVGIRSKTGPVSLAAKVDPNSI